MSKSLRCIAGFHRWDGCNCTRCGCKRDEGHQWEGGTCVKCGRTQQPEHDLGTAPEITGEPSPAPEPLTAPPEEMRLLPKSVDVRCPKCGHEFRRPLGLVGHREKCPECRFVFVIPPAVAALSYEGDESSGTIPSGRDTPQVAAQARAGAPAVVPEEIANDGPPPDSVDGPASRQTAGGQITEDKVAGFAGVQTTNPVEAVDILFDDAIPATPSITRGELEEGFRRIRALWGSTRLHSGSREHIKALILANLQRMCSSEVVDEIGIGVFAEQRAAQVSLRLKHIGFVQVRIWHSGDQFFACGNGCFE
jgi:hypothetical protein